MKKLVIEFSNERLITPSGLSLVGQMLGKSNFIKMCNNMKVDGKRSQSQIKNGDILLSYIGLLCQGKTSYDAINEMSDDPEYYKLALGITRAIPSAETLRQRMDEIGSSLREEILNANVAMFNTFHVQPSALESELVPLDLDVTPMDNSKTHKEGESKTITMRIVYDVIERTTDKNGQFLLVPDIECNTIWTNLGWSDDDIIKGYHAHGECEQFHSEIKTDMDVERLPSGKFDTNELVLELTVLAYNILRLIGQESMKSKRAPKTKHPVKRRRIRTVIGNLIQIAGHITTHGRRIVLAIGCSNVWRHTFMDVYNRFASA